MKTNQEDDELRDIVNELKGIIALESNMVNLAFDPYEDAVAKLKARDEHRDKVHLENYRWLLGYYTFPVSEPGARYNWRTELRERIPESMQANLYPSREEYAAYSKGGDRE